MSSVSLFFLYYLNVQRNRLKAVPHYQPREKHAPSFISQQGLRKSPSQDKGKPNIYTMTRWVNGKSSLAEQNSPGFCSFCMHCVPFISLPERGLGSLFYFFCRKPGYDSSLKMAESSIEKIEKCMH